MSDMHNQWRTHLWNWDLKKCLNALRTLSGGSRASK